MTAAFAIPGDLTQPTGGFVYERRLLESLRALGHDVRHVTLPDSFPDPTPEDVDSTVAALQAGGPVILDGFVSGALPTAAMDRIPAPKVAVVHHPLALESGLAPDRAAYLYRTERDNLARMVHVLVPSPHTKSILVDRYGVTADRITVARPGVDRPAGTPAPVDPPLILSVGILHPRKGHDVLIAALSALKDLDWQAVIVGAPWDPSHAADLSARVAAADLSSRVTLAGRVETDALHRLYRQARLFALATRYEGYGIVFDEALAAGLPIVTCATGAVPDTVPADASHLVAPDDPAAMADAVRKMLTDAETYDLCRAAAVRHGAALADWAATAALAGAVLDRLAEG